jgi:hypothetical protein
MQVFYRLAESCWVMSAFHTMSISLDIEEQSVCKPNAFKYLNNGVLILSPVNSELLWNVARCSMNSKFPVQVFRTSSAKEYSRAKRIFLTGWYLPGLNVYSCRQTFWQLKNLSETADRSQDRLPLPHSSARQTAFFYNSNPYIFVAGFTSVGASFGVR